MPVLSRKMIFQQRVKFSFFVALSLLVGYLSWKIFQPYLLMLATALIVAVVFSPLHKMMVERLKQNPRLASLMITGLVIILAGLPLLLGGAFLIQELSDLANINQNGQIVIPDSLRLHPWFKYLPGDFTQLLEDLDISSLTSALGSLLAKNLNEVLSGTATFALTVFLFLFSLYYFLAEREYLHKKALAMSPLANKIDESIIKRLVKTIRAVVVGNVVVGFIQAVLAGIGFLIFGLPGAMIWSAVTFLASQIPMIGTGMVIVPGSIYLMLTGNVLQGVALLGWGLLLVGTIDNFIRPYLVGGQTKMHPLPVLLAMLGGLQVFGAVGFIIGPAVLAAALGFIEMLEEGVLEGEMRL